jgi:hypothetical protein
MGLPRSIFLYRVAVILIFCIEMMPSYKL